MHLEDEGFKHTRFKVLEVSALAAKDAHSRVSSALQRFLKSVLKILELDHVQTLITSIENFDGLFRDDEGTLLVPNLKSIKFVDPELLLDYPEVTRRLFEELTFLERIDNHFSNKFLSSIVSINKAHCVKHIQLYELPEKETLLDGEIRSQEENSELMVLEDQRTSLGSLLKFVQEHQPRVESMSISDNVHLSQKNEPVLRKLIQIICASSYESLLTLSLSLSHLRLVSRVYTRPMVGVKCIFLKSGPGSWDPDGLLSQTPINEMFPSLTEVILQGSGRFCSDPDENIFEEQLFETCEGSPQPCLSVQTISLKVYHVDEDPWSIGNVARIFPNVHNLNFFGMGLSTTPGNEFPKILSSIWKAWSKLLVFQMWAMNYRDRVDAVSFETRILGISDEEWSVWKELQRDGSTGELVKTMQYAPSNVSFRNCKNLKEVKASFNIDTVIVKCTDAVCLKRLHLFSPPLDEALDEAELNVLKPF